MKERPIIFSTPMVQAILDGRKTQTRRIIKPQPDEDCYYLMELNSGILTINYNQGDKNPKVKCPYGQPGDLLWVRESFAKATDPDGDDLYYYKADRRHADGKWKPSIHMPKAAARIWLRVKDVRVERVQDITEGDAIKEGIKPEFDYLHNSYENLTPKCSFMTLWRKINGRESWDANPWVWVVEFERAPFDSLKGPARKFAPSGVGGAN